MTGRVDTLAPPRATWRAVPGVVGCRPGRISVLPDPIFHPDAPGLVTDRTDHAAVFGAAASRADQ